MRSSVPWLSLPILALAVLVLTAVLASTGGPMNPFSLLYLVLALVAALLLDAVGTWAIVVLGAVAYGCLFMPPFNPHAHHLDSHLLGMWIAYLVVGPLTAIAVRGLRNQLADAHTRQEQTEKLAALATLAAGAAHELATPLSTIHVAAHELARNAGDDARLIVAEVERATDVLGRLSADVGIGIGESPSRITAGELVEAVLARLADPKGVRCEVEGEADDTPLHLPPLQVARALKGVVGNACEASDPSPVVLRIASDGSALTMQIDDSGAGLSDETLRRIGEPFFTTKPPGRGMGLGVFFARSILDLCSGTLDYERRPEGGTRATVRLPVRSDA